MKYGVLGAVLSLLLAGSTPCRAQQLPPNDSQQPSPVEARRWYGWQTLTTDGVAAGLFVGAVAADGSAPLYGSSALVFGLGAPVVHLAHRHWEYALCSLGLRVATPLLGAVIGSQFDGETHSTGAASDHSSAKGATTGVAIGGVAASLLDAFILAYDEQAGRAVTPPRNQLLQVDAYPSLLLLPHGAVFGLSGSL